MVGTWESLTHASRGDWLYRSRAMLHSSYVEKNLEFKNLIVSKKLRESMFCAVCMHVLN